jgi:hypothetical protein
MRYRVKPSSKRKFKNHIQDVLLEGMSVKVKIVIPSEKIECYNCFFDKHTQKSTNECKWTYAETTRLQREYEESGGIMKRYQFFVKGRCPVCKGEGYLESISRRKWIKCKVNWHPEGEFGNSTGSNSGGSIPVEIKAHPMYFELFKNSKSVVIDGTNFSIEDLPVITGIGNKSIMHIMVYTTDKVMKNKILKRYYG